MKTSVIGVHDMLSVLSVAALEKRIGEVPGVESVTVNFAAGSATVRYDETRLKIADIRSGVRQIDDEPARAPPPVPAPPGKKSEVHAKPPAKQDARPDAKPKAAADATLAPRERARPAQSADMAHEMGHGGYNVIAFPLAAGVLFPFVLSPEIAALSMSGSTLLVAINALLLKRTRLAGIRTAKKEVARPKRASATVAA